MTRTNPKPATCDRCKSTDVAWQKSKKSGKFYLTEVFTDKEGDRVTAHNDFHSKYCGGISMGKLDHDDEQRSKYGDNERQGERWDGGNRAVAEEEAFRISSLIKPEHYVLEIAKLAKKNSGLAVEVLGIWNVQGERLYADILAGALNVNAD